MNKGIKMGTHPSPFICSEPCAWPPEQKPEATTTLELISIVAAQNKQIESMSKILDSHTESINVMASIIKDLVGYNSRHSSKPISKIRAFFDYLRGKY